ncbi:MAG TPA: nuclear transport factor 2 family protein [Terracidiphilus sp.]|nr:nuclear transport factor 2 family protein [Terracidiphilus sp.]
MTREDTVRHYYSAWEKKEWNLIDGMLADGFTFISPNDSDRLNRREFHTKCWPEAGWIKRFDLESVAARDSGVFVRYLCHTRNGRSFRNIEYFQFSDEKIASIECYFGGQQGHPSQNASVEEMERILSVDRP